MQVFSINIEVYVKTNGKSPFIEWLNSLKDRKARAKIRVCLDRVKLGNMGDCKSIGDGFYELKILFGPGYRVYFRFVTKTDILLLYGGDKSTQRKDIQKSMKFWRDYLDSKS